MKLIGSLVILAITFVGSEGLQCYNCKQSKVNGVKVEDGSTACKGSEETCEDGMNACMTAKFSFTMDMGQKVETETVQTQCLMNIGEEAACQQMKSVMTESGAPIEDFTCSVIFCDTDLCTDGENDDNEFKDNSSSGKTAHFSLFLSVSLVALYGVFF